MKKSLVALAALAVVSAASAQSSVTMYGVMDVSLEKATGTSATIAPNRNLNSRIGFRGVEDLGGGLKADFVIESGLNSDVGGFSSNSGFSGIGNRQSTLGLSGGFGRVIVGRQWTGNFWTQINRDSTGNAYFDGGGTGTLFKGATSSRVDNAVRYLAPVMGGFQASASFGLKGDAQAAPAALTNLNSSIGTNQAHRNAASTTKMGYSVGLEYNAGPISAGFGAQRDPGLRAGSNKYSTMIGGSYDFGMAKLAVLFERDANEVTNKNAWFISASAPVGVGKVMFNYGLDQSGNAATLGQGLDTKLIQAAYNHPLSKRTSVYAATGRASGDGPAASVTRTQLGMTHTF